MGYIKHHAILVTSWDEVKLKLAHDKATELHSTLVSEIVTSKINKYSSFFIAPDGSKEGWEESNLGDSLRDLFIKWLDNQSYDDGSSSLQYVELYYGEDNNRSEILRHN